MNEKKITLPEREMPTHWYNLAADLPQPLKPPIHPGTHEPLGPDDLALEYHREKVFLCA